jgi:phage shock protein PspC (stress-responsive transcriptional regulator)
MGGRKRDFCERLRKVAGMARTIEQEAPVHAGAWVKPNILESGTMGRGMMNTETMNTETMNTETVNTETVNSETVNSETVNSEAQQTASPHNGQASAAGSDPAQPRKQMLYRHPQDRLVGGICGGVADLVGWDANLIRILWVIVTLATGGGGFLAYLLLWGLLPVGTRAEGQVHPAALALNERNMGRTAVVLIGVGVLWLLANVGMLPWLWSGFWRVTSIVLWPALLIGAGYLLLRYAGRGEWNLNWNWRGTTARMQSEVNGRMPTKESVRAQMRAARARFPLKRSRTDRIFMGVCGGMGKRLGIDANLVRLVWAAFSVGSIGMGVLIYVLLGLFLPEEVITDVQPYDDEGQDVQVIDVRTSHL